MNRMLIVLLLTGAFPGATSQASAQSTDPKAKAEPTETVVRLKVQAAPAPSPVLRYQLLPELSEMNPGNPIHGYLVCFSETGNIFYSRKAIEDGEKWLTLPLKELPLEKLRGYGWQAVQRANHAARLDTPDWMVLSRFKEQGVELIVSDLQQMRSLSEVLRVRCRVEIADRRFDDAFVVLKTMFALSRHTADHPTAMGFLLGQTIATMGIESLDEMIAQPGSPNLFWALADLPQPFNSPRLAVQGERMDFLRIFGMVDESKPMTDSQVRKAIAEFQSIQDDFDGYMRSDPKHKGKPEIPQTTVWFDGRSKDPTYLATARKRLIELGTNKAMIDRFSPLQVAFLDQRYMYEEHRDELCKGVMLPYWQLDSMVVEKSRTSDFPLAQMLERLGPMIKKVPPAQARVEQRFALLRCVEAVRLHAAEHGGKLPAQLADVKLPLPVDPVTGKSLDYRLDGDTAVLHGTPPRGFEKDAYFNVRYEVTITK